MYNCWTPRYVFAWFQCWYVVVSSSVLDVMPLIHGPSICKTVYSSVDMMVLSYGDDRRLQCVFLAVRTRPKTTTHHEDQVIPGSQWIWQLIVMLDCGHDLSMLCHKTATQSATKIFCFSGRSSSIKQLFSRTWEMHWNKKQRSSNIPVVSTNPRPLLLLLLLLLGYYYSTSSTTTYCCCCCVLFNSDLPIDAIRYGFHFVVFVLVI